MAAEESKEERSGEGGAMGTPYAIGTAGFDMVSFEILLSSLHYNL